MRLDAQREESRAALDYYQRLSQRALDRSQLSSASTSEGAQVPLVAQRDGSTGSTAESAQRGWCASSDADVQHPRIFPYHCSWLCQWFSRICCCLPAFCCSYKQVRVCSTVRLQYGYGLRVPDQYVVCVHVLVLVLCTRRVGRSALYFRINYIPFTVTVTVTVRFDSIRFPRVVFSSDRFCISGILNVVLSTLKINSLLVAAITLLFVVLYCTTYP